LLLAGCSASIQIGGVRQSAPHTSSALAPATLGGSLSQGEWLAQGLVLDSRGGGAIKSGERIDRIWFFQHQCAKGRCAMYWTRPIDTGVFTTEVTRGPGSAFSATFRDESAPCTSGTSNVLRAFGLITSTFKLQVGPGPDHLSASEHTYATTPACSALDRTIRWTAIRVTGRLTASPPSAASA